MRQCILHPENGRIHFDTKRELTGLLARDTGHRVEEIEAAIGYDNFMKADEAVAFGICDRVVDRV